jgi:hypothetical protein
MKIPEIELGKRLTVGANPIPVTCLGIGPTEIRGTAAIQGPVIIGASQSFPIPNAPEASLMLARTTNPEAPVVPSILKVTSRAFPPTPIDVMIGDVTGPVGISVNSLIINILNATVINITSPITNGVGAFNWVGAKNLTGVSVEAGALVEVGAQAQSAQESRSGSKVINGATVINGALVVNGATHINGFLSFSSSIVGTTKKFDIPHPTKPNHRLAHICLEGPEAGVYYRGKLENSNKIQLPNYWKGLVHLESVTVNLTSHKYYQELFVKEITESFIAVENNAGQAINCSYTIFGKRKDVKDLVVEYEGNEIIHH